MASDTPQWKWLVKRQLFLLWVAVGVSWAYAFTLVGEASWNLGWTVALWTLFTVWFAYVSVTTLTRASAAQSDVSDRMATLEERIDELESESANPPS